MVEYRDSANTGYNIAEGNDDMTKVVFSPLDPRPCSYLSLIRVGWLNPNQGKGRNFACIGVASLWLTLSPDGEAEWMLIVTVFCVVS